MRRAAILHRPAGAGGLRRRGRRRRGGRRRRRQGRDHARRGHRELRPGGRLRPEGDLRERGARRGDRACRCSRPAASTRSARAAAAWAPASCSTARARSPPTRTWSPPARARRSRARREVYVEFADGNQVEAEIVGADPNADIALLKIDPKGLKLRPLPLGESASVEVGEPVAAIGSPFGEKQSLSVGVISAIDRSIDVADQLRHLGRVPDRRGDQPRQLRRPAGRRRGPRDRRQPADQVDLRRRRGRRLRGPGRRGQALDRQAARRRRGPLRLPRGLLGRALPAARRPLRARRRARAPGSRTSTPAGPPRRPACAAAAAR